MTISGKQSFVKTAIVLGGLVLVEEAASTAALLVSVFSSYAHKAANKRCCFVLWDVDRPDLECQSDGLRSKQVQLKLHTGVRLRVGTRVLMDISLLLLLIKFRTGVCVDCCWVGCLYKCCCC